MDSPSREAMESKLRIYANKYFSTADERRFAQIKNEIRFLQFVTRVANKINIDLNLVEWRIRLFICVYLRSSAVKRFGSRKFASIRGLSL
jgi:hypothetical protein